MTLFQIIGLFAPGLFLYAYAMVSLGRWQSTELRFHLLNFLGAGCILISMVQEWNLPVFLLELAWCSISIYGMAKTLRR